MVYFDQVIAIKPWGNWTGWIWCPRFVRKFGADSRDVSPSPNSYEYTVYKQCVCIYIYIMICKYRKWTCFFPQNVENVEMYWICSCWGYMFFLLGMGNGQNWHCTFPAKLDEFRSKVLPTASVEESDSGASRPPFRLHFRAVTAETTSWMIFESSHFSRWTYLIL